MKQVILLQLLASLAAGVPVVLRQDGGVDATAFGQSWIQKVEDFVKADKDVSAETKKALINSMGNCVLIPIEPLKLPTATAAITATSYQPVCPISDSSNVGDAVDAATLGQAWITQAGRNVGKAESLQTKQKILGSILDCKISREPGPFIGDPSTLGIFCPTLSGDHDSLSTGTAPATQKEEKNSGLTEADEGQAVPEVPPAIDAAAVQKCRDDFNKSGFIQKNACKQLLEQKPTEFSGPMQADLPSCTIPLLTEVCKGI